MLSKKKKKKSYMKQIHKTVPHKTKQHNMKQSKSNSRSLTSPSPDFSIFLNCLNRPIKKLHRKLSRNHQFKEHDIRMDRSIIHSQQVFPSVSIIRDLITHLFWLSTEAVAFSPRPHPYLPCFAPLSRERLSLHCSPN